MGSGQSRAAQGKSHLYALVQKKQVTEALWTSRECRTPEELRTRQLCFQSGNIRIYRGVMVIGPRSRLGTHFHGKTEGSFWYSWCAWFTVI